MRYVDAKNKHFKRSSENKRGRGCTKKKYKGLIVAIIFLSLTVCLGFIFRGKVGALFDPVSIISSVSNVDLDQTDGRTNILLLGLDRRNDDESVPVLTDTLLFVSISRVDNSVAMISLPRDLRVEVDGGYPMKINAVYDFLDEKENYGVAQLEKVVEDVLGMPIHYYSVVDFGMFIDVIDTLGGVEVDVENEFVDYRYPIQGKEDDLCDRTTLEIERMGEDGAYLNEIFPCRYETIQFDSGVQIMDGEKALRYVRSRKGTNGEGTDFKRSRRQQQVIMAIKNKVLSMETLIDISKVRELYNLYSENVDTDMTFKDIKDFYSIANEVDFNSVRSIVLDDRSGASQGGLLYHPSDTSLYGGAYVLIPRVGDYSQIRAYVQKYIFGEL